MRQGFLQLIEKDLGIDLRLTEQASKGAHLDCSMQRYDAPSRALAHHHMTAVLPYCREAQLLESLDDVPP